MIKQCNPFNSYIYYIIKNLLKLKELSYDSYKIREKLSEQINNKLICNEHTNINIKNVKYGIFHRNDKDIYNFFLDEYDYMVKDIIFYGFENNKKIIDLIGLKCAMQPDDIKAALRIITGILVGFECRGYNIDGRKIIKADIQFNKNLQDIIYLLIRNHKLEYEVSEFKLSFIQQMADTEENNLAISYIEFGKKKYYDKIVLGLKLISKDILLSEFILLFLNDTEIYNEVLLEFEDLTFDQYNSICNFISIVLNGFECYEY